MKKLLFFLTFWAYAQVPCKSVNLFLNPKWGYAAMTLTGENTRWNHYQKQMPIYDQGKTGICYAYTAIQMVDYWRQTMGIRASSEILLSSPLYAALLSRIDENSPSFNQKKLDGGYIETSIKAIRNIGMCREDVIKERINIISKEKKVNQNEFLELLEIIFSTLKGGITDLEKMSPMEIYDSFLKGKMSHGKYEKILENSNISLLLKTMAPFIKNGELTKLMKELFSECLKPESIYVGSKNIPDPKQIIFESERFNDQAGVKSHIRSLFLVPKAQPLGVGYCSKFLIKHTYEGINKDLSLAPDCGPHASILMGMQEIDGKCHYLLRNTWGSGCSYAWKCKFNAKNEATGIWVEEESFIKNLLNLVYLKNKDLFCLAKDKLNEIYFEMDIPHISMKEIAKPFGNDRALLFMADQKVIKFLYRNNFHQHVILQTEIKHLGGKTFNASFHSPLDKLELKIACTPNDNKKSELKANLQDLISDELICLAKTRKNERIIEINDPTRSRDQYQYRSLSKGEGDEFVMFETDKSGNILISYGLSKFLLSAERKNFGPGPLKLPFTTRIFNTKEKRNLHLACINNGTDKLKLQKTLREMLPKASPHPGKELVCLAQTPYEEDYFRMEFPIYPSQSLQQLNILNHRFLIEVAVGADGKTTFKYGKNKQNLHLIKTVDKMTYPQKMRFALPSEQLNLKLACDSNKSNENDLKAELKKINNSKDFLCMAKNNSELDFFELDHPSRSPKKIQIFEIFRKTQNIFVVKESGSINFKYGNLVDNADLIASFPEEKIQMPLKGKLFNPGKNIDLKIVCLENDPLNKNLPKELQNIPY